MIDEVAIRLKARQFMAGLDLSNTDSDLSVYARKVNARLAGEELGRGESGYTLTRRDGRASIVVNDLERRERQRFSACHEVGHLVLGLASNHRETPAWSYAKRDDNEIACDIFASELLMPYDAFKRDVDQESPSFELVDRLRATYVVSFAACASRLAAVTDYPCAFVFMDSAVVRYASRSKALRDLSAWVELQAPIPPGSVACRLVRDGDWSGEDSGVAQDVWFRDWAKGYDLTELSKHYPNFEETFSLLWFEPDSGPDTPAKSWGGSALQGEDGALKELDGVLTFQKKSKRKQEPVGLPLYPDMDSEQSQPLDDCNVVDSVNSRPGYHRRQLFRFVRHLPVRHHRAAHCTDLRAGVGQASGEETAAHATVPRSSYGYGDSGAGPQPGMAPQPASSL